MIDTSERFHPETFERAIHGLQDILLKFVRYENDYNDESDPEHTLDVDSDERSTLQIQPNTVLYDACKQFTPRYWNQSIVIDVIKDDSYGYRASVNCGDGIVVCATIFVQKGDLSRLDIGHHSIIDPTEFNEVTSISRHISSRKLTHLIRWLEQSATAGYAKCIPSAATAFDFIFTRDAIPASGTTSPSRRKHRENVFQSEWASIREKTQQTVSDNVRAARAHLSEIPEGSAFQRSGPALEEIPESVDFERGDIWLV
ncbi:hypothetical protein [Halococcus salifodinae]|uniref:hypothetical protein n=1 Tax=Halococcus salifodinae TaxID=36738 RepID=UPI0012693CE8|nr:hypothetical protein [Halococcus salifodinae]